MFRRLKLKIDPGGKYLLGFAKKKLKQLTAMMAMTGQTLGHKSLLVEGKQISIKSMPGCDLIMISGGGELRAFSARDGHLLFSDFVFTPLAASTRPETTQPEPSYLITFRGAARALQISRPDIAEKLLNATGVMGSDSALFDGVTLRLDPQLFYAPTSDIGKVITQWMTTKFAEIIEPFAHPEPLSGIGTELGTNRLRASYSLQTSHQESRSDFLNWLPGILHVVFSQVDTTVMRRDYQRGFAGWVYTETPAALTSVASGSAFAQGYPTSSVGTTTTASGSGTAYVESYDEQFQIESFSASVEIIDGRQDGLPGGGVFPTTPVYNLDFPADFPVATFVSTVQVSRNFSGAIKVTDADDTTLVPLDEQQFDLPAPPLLINTSATVGEAFIDVDVVFEDGHTAHVAGWYLHRSSTASVQSVQIPLRVFNNREVAPPVGLKADALGCLYFPRDDSFLYATVSAGFYAAQSAYFEAPTAENLAALKPTVNVLLRHPPTIDGQPQPGAHDDLLPFLVPGDTVIFV